MFSFFFRLFSGRWKIQAVVQFVALLVIIGRGVMAINGLDMKVDLNKVLLWNVTVCPEVHFELLSTSVVFLGFLLGAMYTVSIVNYVYWLSIVQQQIRENMFRVGAMWFRPPNMLVLAATLGSVVDAFWFFLFVREVWTNHFEVAWQVLQMVPSFFVILDTIFCGMYPVTVIIFIIIFLVTHSALI